MQPIALLQVLWRAWVLACYCWDSSWLSSSLERSCTKPRGRTPSETSHSLKMSKRRRKIAR